MKFPLFLILFAALSAFAVIVPVQHDTELEISNSHDTFQGNVLDEYLTESELSKELNRFDYGVLDELLTEENQNDEDDQEDDDEEEELSNEENEEEVGWGRRRSRRAKKSDVRGEYGATSCVDGYTRVQSESECRAFARNERYTFEEHCHRDETSWSWCGGRPRYCFQDRNGAVIFNQNTNDVSYYNAKPICVKSKPGPIATKPLVHSGKGKNCGKVFKFKGQCVSAGNVVTQLHSKIVAPFVQKANIPHKGAVTKILEVIAAALQKAFDKGAEYLGIDFSFCLGDFEREYKKDGTYSFKDNGKYMHKQSYCKQLDWNPSITGLSLLDVYLDINNALVKFHVQFCVAISSCDTSGIQIFFDLAFLGSALETYGNAVKDPVFKAVGAVVSTTKSTVGWSTQKNLAASLKYYDGRRMVEKLFKARFVAGISFDLGMAIDLFLGSKASVSFAGAFGTPKVSVFLPLDGIRDIFSKMSFSRKGAVDKYLQVMKILSVGAMTITDFEINIDFAKLTAGNLNYNMKFTTSMSGYLTRTHQFYLSFEFKTNNAIQNLCEFIVGKMPLLEDGMKAKICPAVTGTEEPSKTYRLDMWFKPRGGVEVGFRVQSPMIKFDCKVQMKPFNFDCSFLGSCPSFLQGKITEGIRKCETRCSSIARGACESCDRNLKKGKEQCQKKLDSCDRACADHKKIGDRRCDSAYKSCTTGCNIAKTKGMSGCSLANTKCQLHKHLLRQAREVQRQACDKCTRLCPGCLSIKGIFGRRRLKEEGDDSEEYDEVDDSEEDETGSWNCKARDLCRAACNKGVCRGVNGGCRELEGTCKTGVETIYKTCKGGCQLSETCKVGVQGTYNACKAGCQTIKACTKGLEAARNICKSGCGAYKAVCKNGCKVLNLAASGLCFGGRVVSEYGKRGLAAMSKLKLFDDSIKNKAKEIVKKIMPSLTEEELEEAYETEEYLEDINGTEYGQ